MQQRKENHIGLWMQRYWMPLVLLVMCMVEAVFFEKIPVNEGLGWDGAVYAEHTQFFFKLLNEDQIDSYRIIRDFIPFVLHTLLRTFHYLFLADSPISPKQVINAFLIVNSICIVFSGMLLTLLSRKFQWSKSITCFAFVFLFVNFFVLKMSFYYPVLMDVPAFFIAMVCLYAYLENRKGLLLLAMCIGFFVFPGLFLVAALLYLFPKEMVREETPLRGRNNLFYLAIYFLGMVPVSYGIYILVKGSTAYGWTSINRINDALFWISYPALLLYISYLLYWFEPIHKALAMVRFFRIKKGLVVLVLYTVLTALAYWLSNGKASISLLLFLEIFLYEGVTNPFTFLVSHSIYFGLMILFVVCFFRSFVANLRTFGLGFELVVFFYLFFMVNTESRHLVAMLPFLLLVLIGLMEKQIAVKWILVFGLTNILISKIWYPMKIEGYTGILEFPAQHYFMNQGPWMNTDMYWVHLVAFLLIGGFLFWGMYVSKEKIWAKRGNRK